MKKILIVALLPVLSLCLMLPSCLKSNSGPTCSDVAPSEEDSIIQLYCMINGINYIKDTTGLYYQILDPGTDPKPTLNSTVYATYEGKMLNSTLIDSSSARVPLPLNQLIPAWQIGLQKIGEGGHIKIVAPSALGYGCYGRSASPPGVSIPANTILYFDITLVDVQ